MLTLRHFLSLVRLVVLTSIVFVAACGGGGGGGGDGDGDSGDYSVSPMSLSFSAAENGSTPSPQFVLATALSGYIAFDIQSSGPFGTSVTFSGAVATIRVTPAAPSSVGPGVHTGTITINGYKDQLGNIPASGNPRVVNVTYTVTSGISATPTKLGFLQISGGAAPAAQTLSFSDTQGGSYPWNATVEYLNGSGWLRLNNGTEASGAALPDSLDVSIQTPATLGTYSAVIHVSGNGRVFDVPVSYTYRVAQIAATPAFHYFSSTVGSPTLPVTKQLTITGENIGWTATTNQPWVQLGSAGGTGPGTLAVGVDPTGLGWGVHTATVYVTDTLGGAPHNVSIALYLEPRRLRVSDDGVALTSTPTISRLSHTITVSENAGAAVGWTATSDQSWLSVTATGNTGDNLVLTADPEGLAAAQVHYANVTVGSSDVTVSNTETVRVGFYVSNDAPVTSPSISMSGSNVIADPIRPYVYTTSATACSAGGSGDNMIGVYNIYTGTLVNSYTGPAGTKLSEMAVASDGSKLYVLDSNDGNIVPVDLDSQTVGNTWYLLHAFSMRGCAGLVYVRVNGRRLVLTTVRDILNAATGGGLGSFALPTGAGSLWYLAASGDGGTLYSIDGNYGLNRHEMAYAYTTGQISIAATHRVQAGINLIYADLATNASGTRAYVASTSARGIFTYDGTALSSTPSVPGSGFTGNVEVGPTGLLYTGEGASGGTAADLWVYSDEGTPVGSANLPDSSISGSLVVSGDGLRLGEIGLGGSPTLLRIISTNP
jgi:hypothetical protein